MKRELITRKSEALDKDMSLIAYGEGGYPVIAFQPQGSKCNAFEDFGMVEAMSDAIENGFIQLFSVDNNDEESWSDTDGDKTARSARQEAFFAFVTDELVPLVRELNGSDARPLAVGCSMGATHAALAALRRPDLFQGCIALSGIYDARYYFGDWMDSTLYGNSVVSFLPNMAADHPYIELYGNRQLVFCVGQGAWEDQGIADLRVIADTCHEKGIDAWCDFWGYDVSHDWPWWKKQIQYFLPIVLDDIDKSLAEERKTTKKAAAKSATKKAATRAKTAARRGAKAVKETAEKAVEASIDAAGKVASDAKSAAKAASNPRKGARKLADSARKDEEALDEKAASIKGDAAGKAGKAVGEAKEATKTAAARTKKAATKAKADAQKVAEKVEGDAESVAQRAEEAVGKAATAARRGAKTAAAKTTQRAKTTASRAKAAARTTATKAKAAVRQAEEKVEEAVSGKEVASE